jgi:hypothetical protein
VVPVEVAKRYAKLTFLAGVVLLLFVYVGDDVIVRLRIASKGSAPFGSVQVLSVTPLKNGRVDIYADPTPEECLHSLFPHLGYAPCWYLTQSPIKRIGLSPLRIGG